jgi:hypothetical protein
MHLSGSSYLRCDGFRAMPAGMDREGKELGRDNHTGMSAASLLFDFFDEAVELGHALGLGPPNHAHRHFL